MNFTLVNELREKFDTEGAFYQINLSGKVYKCRGLAKISRSGSRTNTADALFVLLNPGSCQPADNDYQFPNHNNELSKIPLVQAKSDATQHQIMRLMERMNWKMVYIINLSDLRAGNVEEFKVSLDDFDSRQNESHSIFSLERKKNIYSLLSERTKLIVGWGTNSVIKNRAIHAFHYLSRIDDYKVHGLPHAKHPYYYHPYPMVKEKCIKWLDDMSEKLAEDEKNEFT